MPKFSSSQEVSQQHSLPPVRSQSPQPVHPQPQRSIPIDSNPQSSSHHDILLNQTLDDESRLRLQINRFKGAAIRQGQEDNISLKETRKRIKSEVQIMRRAHPGSGEHGRKKRSTSNSPLPRQQHEVENELMDWKRETQSPTGMDDILHNQEVQANDQFDAAMHSPPLPMQILAFNNTLPISNDYSNYKKPVLLCELSPTGPYDFAQPFLEDIFTSSNLYASHSPYKWHSHTTLGFISQGTRLSFLVLRNAADPFQHNTPSASSTSIGVYGRYDNEVDQIHWKTFTPDMTEHLQKYLSEGFFSVTCTWHHDMPRASERRFHRAYWLAANMKPLGGLLTRARITFAAHDAIENDAVEEGEIVELTEDDLQTSWNDMQVSDEEAQATWAKVLQEGEDESFRGAGEYEHVVTGCSEREL